LIPRTETLHIMGDWPAEVLSALCSATLPP